MAKFPDHIVQMGVSITISDNPLKHVQLFKACQLECKLNSPDRDSLEMYSQVLDYARNEGALTVS